MRIGIATVSPNRGGVYQYSRSIIAALDPAAAEAEGDELVALYGSSRPPYLDVLARDGWSTAAANPPPRRSRARAAVSRAALAQGTLRRAARAVRSRAAVGTAPRFDPDVVRSRPELAAWHARLGIELMLYPAPVTESFEAGTPYVVAVHDLQHRLQPEFPEVSADGQAEAREYLFRNAIARATLVLADSDVGKEDIVELYGDVGVAPDRVKVLPFVAPPYLLDGGAVGEEAVAAARRRYSLPDRYFFYPAQFWPHKNHARLVQALALLEHERGTEVEIVFTGSRASEIRERTHHELFQLAAELGVSERVRDLGYVPEEDIAVLYRGAVALAMPTFFGPTNIPILEAWALGCPVLTSNLRGIREQAGDAALLVDPRSVEALADALHRLWTEETLRRELAERGGARLAEYTPDDFRSRLIEIVRDAKDRLRRPAA